MANSKLCSLCREEIRADAKKCKHCGAEQSKLKRRLAQISFVIGFVLSVASLVSIAVSDIHKLTEKGVALSGRALHTDLNNHLRVVMDNNGKQAAQVMDALVTWSIKDKKGRDFKYSVRVKPEVIQKTIPAGKSEVFELVTADNEALPPMPNPEVELIDRIELKLERPCTIQVIYGAVEQGNQLLEIPYECLL